MNLLEVTDLRISIGSGRAEAVHGVSFSVGRGETVGLVGESGSGKTLACRAVLGVQAPGVTVDSGTIDFDGTDLAGLDRRGWDAVRGSRIAGVFQDPASYLDPSLSVGRQLSEQLRVKLGRGRREAHAEAVDLLASMGLHRPAQVYHQYPHQLSGGMVQRVLIAMAVAAGPELLIADEATTALDVTIAAEVLELLKTLQAERGLSILVVSHDLATIAEVCDRVLVLYAGELVESGSTEQVLRSPSHPYTQALLRVASVDDWSRRQLEVIPGSPPPVDQRRTGCGFADRCPLVQERCRDRPIQLLEDAGRAVRCLRAGEPAVSADEEADEEADKVRVTSS
jgi:peptide/nickel transport system ATP-binding protein